MALIDYEAAWHALAARLASEKTGYGRNELAQIMAETASAHRVSETLQERMLRLYGGRLVLTSHTPEVVPATDGEAELGDGKVNGSGHSTTRGGHDGRREAEVAGSRS